MLRDCWGPLLLATRQDVAVLLRELGWVEETYEPGCALFSSFYDDRPDSALREFLSGFARVVLFTSRTENVLAAGIIRVRPDTAIVRTIPQEGVAASVSDFRFRQVSGIVGMDCKSRRAEARDDSLPPLLLVPGSEQERARRFLAAGGAGEGPVVIVQPGSGGPRKCWPLQRYLELARQLITRHNALLCFITGPADEVHRRGIDDFVKASRGRAVHVWSENLLFVAALMSSGSVYIGNDSGITHLAGLAGSPTIAIFGPTDPLGWGPQGRLVRIVRASCECAPCGDDRSRECQDRRCLSLVLVEQVVQEAEELLRASRLESTAPGLPVTGQEEASCRA